MLLSLRSQRSNLEVTKRLSHGSSGRPNLTFIFIAFSYQLSAMTYQLQTTSYQLFPPKQLPLHIRIILGMLQRLPPCIGDLPHAAQRIIREQTVLHHVIPLP
ncbi:MAG: hypothetical protein XE06_1423 [Anaerolineaceae bacterium 46_22]|nr:MAG: hypothetical protein XE06_1423 [Anaerolineaceae bacterium 46_22]